MKSHEAPVDINLTNNNNAPKTIGVKIIYDVDYRIGESVWIEIINTIIYALINAELIKATQKRDTVRYHANGWYVSLLTIDTFTINNITGKQSETPKTATVQQLPKETINYWLVRIPGLAKISIIIL